MGRTSAKHTADVPATLRLGSVIGWHSSIISSTSGAPSPLIVYRSGQLRHNVAQSHEAPIPKLHEMVGFSSNKVRQKLNVDEQNLGAFSAIHELVSENCNGRLALESQLGLACH